MLQRCQRPVGSAVPGRPGNRSTIHAVAGTTARAAQKPPTVSVGYGASRAIWDSAIAMVVAAGGGIRRRTSVRMTP